MQRRPLVIVTTRLPPQICGVGTFSWLLHRYWPGDKSRDQFLVVDGAAESSAALHHDSIAEFHSNWRALAKALNGAGAVDVLLHYAGRGFQRFGCPIGLPPVLRKWKQKFPQGRLAIFFHEVPGRLPLTSRHYWPNRCNFLVVRQLAKLGDLIVTNTDEHVRTLQRISDRSDIHCLPVGSNIEVVHPPISERARTEFAIFGLPYSRWQTLETFNDDIRRWQENGALTRLHLIGPGDQKFDQRSEALINAYARPETVIRHGNIPAEQISNLLSQAQFALTTANELTWSKSTTLMAYMAHSSVVVAKSKSNVEPLSWMITPDELEALSNPDLQARAEAMRQWYQTNADWKLLARRVSDLLQNLS